MYSKQKSTILIMKIVITNAIVLLISPLLVISSINRRSEDEIIKRDVIGLIFKVFVFFLDIPSILVNMIIYE